MAFMQRLQSKLILNTSLYHPQEAHLVEHPENDIYEAIKLSQNERLEKMILQGFNVDYHECAHTPPLIYAIMLKERRAIEMLLSYGASANICNTHHQSALHVALHYRYYDVIHLLLRYGAKTDTLDNDAITPMQLAEILQDEHGMALLKNTPSMHRHSTDLFESAKNGNLLEITAHKEEEGNLFAKSPKGNSLLHFAVLSRNKKLVCYLLNLGFDIDAQNDYGDTALTLIARHRESEAMLQYLIERHATIEHKNSAHESALMLCIKFGHASSASLLVDNGAEVNTFMNIYTPLTLTHDAINYYTRSADAFRALEAKLLIKGAHVDVITNKLRWTPLIQCATNAHTQNMLEHLELLIKLGADVNHTDANGRTALMLCITMQRKDAINVLLKHYADINIVDKYEWTALMFSCYYNHFALTKLLLQYGANVNFNASNGNSALKIAEDKKNIDLIKLLQDFGALSEE